MEIKAEITVCNLDPTGDINKVLITGLGRGKKGRFDMEDGEFTFDCSEFEVRRTSW